MVKKYQRYQIHTQKAPNLISHPHRFKVKVNRLKLAKLLMKEMVHYRGKMEVVLSRPCVYGVFSGPIGGFAPRERLCVGCLRCTTQYPDMVEILHNPAVKQQGDDYFTSEHIETIIHEAESGRIPIKGAGYRGKFGGKGWDGMWTDMSEIVRPTRDGIHGREYISTQVDIGGKPPYCKFEIPFPQNASIPIPLLFDILPIRNQTDLTTHHILVEASRDLKNFTLIPFETMKKLSLRDHAIIPVVKPEDFDEFKNDGLHPHLIEMSSWNPAFFQQIQSHFSHAIPILRIEFDAPNLLSYYQAGVRVFHLTADYHGRSTSGKFVLDLIREAHHTFVKAKCREEVTLIGSGGMVAAEHIPKAILCGLDAIALDTPVLASLQGKFIGQCTNRENSDFKLPSKMNIDWGKQRLKNMMGAWRDQLIEILGAMGMREVRRMRGEMGRAMLQTELEREAFSGIKGYGANS